MSVLLPFYKKDCFFPLRSRRAVTSSSTSMMDDVWVPLAASLSLIITIPLILSLLTKNNNPSATNLPPKPFFRLPLIGHLHLIKLPLAESLRVFSLRHGPIFSLHFGSRLIVVISSAAAADACFTHNDTIVANRPRLLVGKHVAYNYSTLVTAPYGDEWRKLRRICSTELFSSSAMARFTSARVHTVENLIRRVATEAGGEGVVVVRPLLKEMMFDILMRMVSGEGIVAAGDEFVEMVNEVLVACDTANPADFVPILKWVDFGGFQKQLKKLGKKADVLLQRIVDKKRRRRESRVEIAEEKEEEDSMIDRLLELQKSDPEFYSDVMIKGLLIVIFSAGTDTTSLTIEWAISLLLNNPETLTKLKQEIDTQVGQLRLVNESDLSNLPYLQTIVYETLRLYPPSPLLLPHYSFQDCTISGFTVPQDTMLFINAWAIHRDPTQWPDPLSFKPDRFKDGGGGGGVESSCRFLPFGFGRRACPGSGLGNRVVCLGLAALVQCFDWDRVGGIEIDMEEGEGLTMPKKLPLAAVCKARPIVSECFSS